MNPGCRLASEGQILSLMSTAHSRGLPYPRELETDVVLRDGSTVHVRPIRAADKPAVRAFLEALSPESIGFRFFGVPNLGWATSWSVDVDYADRFALIAESGAPHKVISHAAYVRIDDQRAEVAFMVADAWQGRGISTILLAQLAGVAEQHGITTFTAEVLPVNRRMVDVFRQSGFPVDLRSTPDAIEIELPTSLSPEGLARFEERERAAAVAAVRSFLAPGSVAVVGASRRPATIGGGLLHNLIAGEFNGSSRASSARTPAGRMGSRWLNCRLWSRSSSAETAHGACRCESRPPETPPLPRVSRCPAASGASRRAAVSASRSSRRPRGSGWACRRS
jgi:GNAT superfamily N-acetyltransferase